MSRRDGHALFDQVTCRRRPGIILRSEGHQAHQSPARLEKSCRVVAVRRDDAVRRVRPDVAGLGIQKGPLHVKALHHRPDHRVHLPVSDHPPQFRAEGFDRIGDDRREDPLDPVRLQRLAGAVHLVSGEIERTKIDTGVTVDLKVEIGHGAIRVGRVE